LKTFLDSGVLLAAWRKMELSGAAMKILDDDGREFYTSQLVKLELFPKARFERNHNELKFYETHCARTKASEALSIELGIEAEALAARYGLAGPDALQIAAAIRLGVEEFYTSEKPGKPMFRVKELKVISLHSL